MASTPDRATSEDCVIIERPGELLMQMRGLKHPKGQVMLGILLPFLFLLCLIKGFALPYVVMALLIGYFALMIGLNWSRVLATPAQLVTSFGPIPFLGRKGHVAVVDVREISCTETRTRMARGGELVRYAVQAWTGAEKPVHLLDSELQQDSSACAAALVGWLNANRGDNPGAVTLR